MRIRALAVTVAVIAASAVSASPALAHDCFNPTKNAHAPAAGAKVIPRSVAAGIARRIHEANEPG
jgi:hypothetical protein